MTLKDQNLPPGAIVKKLPNGGAIRNDGVELRPASQNPWYVLATIAGDNPHENRRFWNGWIGEDLSDEERQEIAKKLKVDAAELLPLTDAEQQTLRKHFSKMGLSLPSGAIDFEGLVFNEDVNFIGFYFDKRVSFYRSNFVNTPRFTNAYFADEAKFINAHFCEFAGFTNAHFADVTFFNHAHFASWANLNNAHFASSAHFDNAHFYNETNFENTYFENGVNFSDSVFKGKTNFKNASFKGRVPKFFQSELHQDTSFSEDARLWPKVTNENADDSKRAYTRLRKIAADQYNPDLEHFFLRQEMRCKEVLAGKFERPFFWAYHFFADYGNSILRPALSLISLWIFLAIIFRDANFRAGYMEGPITWAKAFSLSFVNLFSFLGLGKLYFTKTYEKMDGYIAVLASLQMLLGIIFLFLLGLGLRNRFRLK